MEIYLIRHTKPLIKENICYGQTDVPVDMNMFDQSAADILKQLPGKAMALYSSPLSRCGLLAEFIKKRKYPELEIHYSLQLQELNFGEWENKLWEELNQAELTDWMKDFVNVKPPGGENLVELNNRTITFLKRVINENKSPVIVVTHAGVIRSVMCWLKRKPLSNAFEVNFEYASVVKLSLNFQMNQFSIANEY